ncbi:hypothetical protein KP509_20G017000 [Ceratopteris richardii]|uniref:Uncharacterized protein n=1 Tax=Ceratopteris richardii TaxID=49495 RepID=A0A8T2SDF3_CERRI|nr:hypothetical protein KP509_20G017000 [Ceratopteris richardii]
MAASVATRSSFIIHSKNPQLKGYYSLKMKQNASAGSTAVFDFDEGDAEPYYVKKNRFFGFFSKGKNCSEISEENAKSTCKDQAQSLMNERNMAAKQSITYQSPSFSDDIETDDSDSESNQARRQLDIRFRDMHGDSSPGLLMDENVMIDGAREVIIQGEELYFSNKKYIGPEFIFTADAVQLRTKAFRAIKWPLLCINSFGFGCDQTGQPWMEINLSKNGVEWFLQHLGCLDSCSDTVYSRISDDYSCYEQQITSLSDVYKTIWRPWKEIAQDNYKDSIFIQRERTRDILCDWCDLVYPTEDDLDAVTVTKHDYLLLEPDQFLSDTIIDFYIKRALI